MKKRILIATAGVLLNGVACSGDPARPDASAASPGPSAGAAPTGSLAPTPNTAGTGGAAGTAGAQPNGMPAGAHGIGGDRGADGSASGMGGGVGATGSVNGMGSDRGTSGDRGAGGNAADVPNPTTVPAPPPALVTSAAGSYWNVGSLSPTTEAASVTVTVDEQTSYQDWLGFGGTFNEAGWDALAVLSEADRERAIRLLFSPSDGANFAWGRIPIGSSDYALDGYTLNETPGDFAMKGFSLVRDRMHLIPFIRAAQAVKPELKLWASMWTPPTWMKTVPVFQGSDELPDHSNEKTAYKSKMKDDAETLKALALYLARFVEAYALEGIPIAQLHPQNEPGYATRYPSCWWDAGLVGSFIGTYLGPTFEERGLNTEIWFGTLSNQATFDGHINGLTQEAKQYVKGIGLQWGAISKAPGLIAQGYQVIQTEHQCGNYPWLTDTFRPDAPANDHAYAVESWSVIRNWLEAGAHGYSAWNMVLDSAGKNIDPVRAWPQNALLVVDRATKKLTATPAYYVFRHFSAFVAPGAKRIQASGGNALAFKNPDGRVVTVIYNPEAEAARTQLVVGGASVQLNVPARGWATVNGEAH